MDNKNEIFVYVENKTRDVSMELLSAARKLLPKSVCAIYLGADLIDEASAKTIFEAGADKIYEIIDEKLSEFNVKYFANAIIELAIEKKPDIFLFGATDEGRALAPAVSSALNTGLTADCTALEIIEHKNEMKLASTRPTFGGSLMATILCKAKPQMASVREHVLRKGEIYKGSGIREVFKPNLSNLETSLKLLEIIENKEKGIDNLSFANIILAGGMGLKSKENFEKLAQLANKMGAALGATRLAVEAGFAPKTSQIGQTGKTVAPKIYVAFGISGAIHHQSGISNSGYIIAINTDKEAPLMKNCDFAICADAAKTIEELLAHFDKD